MSKRCYECGSYVPADEAIYVESYLLSRDKKPIHPPTGSEHDPAIRQVYLCQECYAALDIDDWTGWSL